MFKILDHEADVGIMASGNSWEEAFSEGAAAMLSIMADASKVEPRQEVGIQVNAGDMAALFVEFLNEILFIRDRDEMFLSKFDITIKGGSLAGKAWGEKIDQKKHGVKIEVKAATYAALKAWEKGGEKFVECILDV